MYKDIPWNNRSRRHCS